MAGCSRQTVIDFFAKRPTDKEYFQKICKVLGFKWEDVADFRDELEVNTSEDIQSNSGTAQQVLVDPASTEKKDKATGKSKAVFVLSGTIDTVNTAKLKAFEAHLRLISGDASLTITKVEEGSIKITLEGSPEGLEWLKELFESGKLNEVLGIPVEDVQLATDETSNNNEKAEDNESRPVQNDTLQQFEIPNLISRNNPLSFNNVVKNNVMKNILILTANPKDTSRLRLDQEVRDIAEGLKRAKKRAQFVLESKLAVQPRDIQRAMLDINPSIVHFSGHGTGDEGLVFEDETGSAKLVDGEALAGLFELFAEQLECVVLNGCYSEVQADAIVQHVNYVIGMKKAIGDKAAIEFAVGFYDALGAGRTVEFAYKLGCAAIRLAGVPEQLTPILKKKSNIEETVAKRSWSNDQPSVKNEPAFALVQELNDSDREILTELLIRSGRAEYSARKALCIKIGIEPNKLGFLRQSTDIDFALELISYLHSVDDKQALYKICKELEVVFTRGKYSANLDNIKSKLNLK